MQWLKMTDYKIQSKAVFQYVLVGQLLIAFCLLLADLFVDLKSGSLQAYTLYFFASAIVVLIGFNNAKSNWSRAFIPILEFAMGEHVFLSTPQSFHVILFWFSLIPVISLILQGLRASQIWSIVIFITFIFNSIYLQSMRGDSYEMVIFRLPTFIGGSIFLASVLISIYLLYNLLGNAYYRSIEKNKELIKLKNSLEEKKNLMQDYNAAMLELSRNPDEFKSLTSLFESIASIIYELLQINRVSIWLYTHHGDQIERKILLQDGKVEIDDVNIQRKHFPKYFDALEKKPFIMATLAEEHTDTQEFTESYLKPNHIISMLDCPIVLDQKAIGVICCEQTNYARAWVAEDTLITQSLADFIALHFKNERIKDLMTKLQNQNQELSLQSNEIASMNRELHSLNQKLIESNGSLESTVRKRTEELIKQNNQLKEYAFVNSHMLRAPLSSILGISSLLQTRTELQADQELIDALYKSTDDLDQVVRSISTTLEDGSNLTRKDIDFIINQRFKQTEAKRNK
ncbi:GAF domain-containing protein [Reichenbachiella agarivorans]|uniref:histidine kinase n=1 Tax=Reichenbachiella agarivorans TaxID=2979464 RepID=A0ABY6CLY4_9BACT|nr:GAF domain-containing protein [Reichenbachiella agarivorans]UXP31524.1 GAF domain-containing protein [Reichenbachiella agarivorans]